MRDIAVISFAQTPQKRRVEDLNEVEMLMPAVHQALSERTTGGLDTVDGGNIAAAPR